jgi:acid phosphatase
MALWKPTRREFIATAPTALGAAALPAAAQMLPRSRNLRFLVVGDWGRDGAHYQKHVARLMAQDAALGGFDFVVSTGDNFYKMGVTSSDDRQWLSSFEHIYPSSLRSQPWFAVAGNHDWGGNVFAQLDRSGRGGWSMPWLWYDVPGRLWHREDVHLFFIDTVVWNAGEDWLYRICGQALRSIDHARQKAWLERALAASSAATKIVFGHHPIFSVAKHGKGLMHMKSLDDILVANGVSAYVCGHDHCLYHISRDKVPGDTMHYVCSGGGSEELSDYTGDPRAHGCVIPGHCGAPNPQWHTYLDRAGFAVFDVGRDQTRFHFVDRDGRPTEPKTITQRRRTSNGGPLAAPPANPASLPEDVNARATSLLPCTSIARALGL